MDKVFPNKVVDAARAVCWVTCHNNAEPLPSSGEKATTKYIAVSRLAITRKSGDDIKFPGDLEKIRTSVVFLEYWQARLKPGAAPDVVDGAILEKREEYKMPAITAEAIETNGRWAVTFSRKLKAGSAYKDVVASKTYTLGFSVHAVHTAKRFHYVSLEPTLVLDGGEADFVAKAP
jgi:Ethylbenzene dehydrogenase